MSHPQDLANEKIRADLGSVSFAEEAKLDACRSYLSGQITVQSYSEVEQAHYRVLRIFQICERSKESS